MSRPLDGLLLDLPVSYQYGQATRMKAVDANGRVLVGDFPCRKVHGARGIG